MPLLPVQTRDALRFWPLDDVVLIRPEHAGRFTVVHGDGTVAWRPTHPGDGPWIRVENLLVHPAHMGRLPDGWTVPSTPPLPMSPPRPHRRSVEVRCGPHAIDPERVRAVHRDEDCHVVTLDDGSTLRLPRVACAPLAQALNLPHLDHLEPIPASMRPLYDLGLRDWPAPLLDMPAEPIQRYVGDDEGTLIANVLWQTYRLRSTGQAPDYGRDHRAFWHLPLQPILARLGFVKGGTWLYGDDDPHYRAYLRELDRLVNSVLSFTDLGFAEQRPDLRTVGDVHPSVLIVAERVGLKDLVQGLGACFGVSTFILDGDPTQLATEHLAAGLQGTGPIHVVAFVDYDPAGWIGARAQAAQLVRYGLTVERISFLVRPDRFTADERSRITVPIATADATHERLLEKWLEESGGVDGEARAIHAEYLRPLDRAASAFTEVTGLTAR